MSLIIEKSPWIYLILTCMIGGGAAFMTGRALATNWRPLWHLAVAALILGCGLRFFEYALFHAKLLSIHYYITDTLVLFIFALLGFQLTRTRQMVTQYHWLYRRTSPFTWADK